MPLSSSSSQQAEWMNLHDIYRWNILSLSFSNFIFTPIKESSENQEKKTDSGFHRLPHYIINKYQPNLDEIDKNANTHQALRARINDEVKWTKNFNSSQFNRVHIALRFGSRQFIWSRLALFLLSFHSLARFQCANVPTTFYAVNILQYTNCLRKIPVNIEKSMRNFGVYSDEMNMSYWCCCCRCRCCRRCCCCNTIQYSLNGSDGDQRCCHCAGRAYIWKILLISKTSFI